MTEETFAKLLQDIDEFEIEETMDFLHRCTSGRGEKQIGGASNLI